MRARLGMSDEMKESRTWAALLAAFVILVLVVGSAYVAAAWWWLQGWMWSA